MPKTNPPLALTVMMLMTTAHQLQYGRGLGSMWLTLTEHISHTANSLRAGQDVRLR